VLHIDHIGKPSPESVLPLDLVVCMRPAAFWFDKRSCMHAEGQRSSEDIYVHD
jgi:hypothetical protein